MNSSFDLSPQQLRKAADIKERIDSMQRELARLLGSTSFQSANNTPASTKRTMSAAVRARISAAAKKRWAKIKGMRSSATQSSSSRKMSAAAKARLSAIARARWKKARAQGRTAL